MKLIVISNSGRNKGEIDCVVKMFEHGLEFFHLRKSKWSSKELEEYIKRIPKQYRSRVVIHSHYMLAGKYQLGGIHLGRRWRKKKKFRKWLEIKLISFKNPNVLLSRSFNRLSRLLDNKKVYDYVFLSPIFDGISRKGHAAGYSMRKLKSVLPKLNQEIVALGGVEPSRIQACFETGFAGFGLWGCIWQTPGKELEVFLEAKLELDRIMVEDAQRKAAEKARYRDESPV